MTEGAELWVHYVLEPCTSLTGPEYRDIALFVVGSQLLHLCTFWVHSLVYIAIDMNPKLFPNLRRWKTQPDVYITRDQLWKAVTTALFNQMFVNIPFAFVSYVLFSWRGLTIEAEDLPSAGTLLRHFVVFAIVEEIGFYYGHRTCHHPSLYAPIHKV